MTTGGILLAVLVSAVCTFALRALPFLAFSGERRMPLWLDRLGQVLPAAIMAVLIVYCLKDVGSDLRGIAFPKGIAVAGCCSYLQMETQHTHKYCSGNDPAYGAVKSIVRVATVRSVKNAVG